MTDLRQLHFRFRTDAGTADAAPTWGAGEDVNYYPGTANFRLRIGLRNASTVVAATPWELYVSRNGDAYTPVTTTIAKGVQSVDAGASADDTAVLIPRLYPFSPDWELSEAAVDLDFAGSRIYPGGQFTDYLSISRASTGYAKTVGGALTSFGTNTLRITDAGLLCEDARTNDLTHSQDLSTWSVFNLTATDNSLAAPDGTTTADLLNEGTATNIHELDRTTSSLIGTTQITLSAYVRAGTGNFFKLAPGVTAVDYIVAIFDLSNGTVSQTGTGPTSGTITGSGIEALGSGWYRCWVSGTTTSGNPWVATVGMVPTATGNSIGGGGGVSYTGASKTTYCWGVQLEAGSFPSSYIPTTTVAATRATDVVQCISTLATILTNTTYSVVSDAILPDLPLGSSRWTTLTEGGAGENEVLDYSISDNSVSTRLGPGGTAVAGNSQKPSTGMKSGFAKDASSQSLVAGGGTVNAMGSTQTIASAYLIQASGAAAFRPFGYIRRFTAWNSRLDDATLDALTAP